MDRMGNGMYTILIVDDEKIERNGIKFLLKKLEDTDQNGLIVFLKHSRIYKMKYMMK